MGTHTHREEKNYAKADQGADAFLTTQLEEELISPTSFLGKSLMTRGAQYCTRFGQRIVHHSSRL